MIIAPRFPRLKEWAYAGSFFQFSGAVAALLAGDVVEAWLAPLVFLMFVVSYLTLPWVTAALHTRARGLGWIAR